MKTNIITVKTITIGLKGKKALAKNGIKANIVKVDSTKSQEGCGYGLEFNTRDFYSVITVLRENGINYGVYKEK